jgi:uncharacterized Zn-binding protein involved in type VI secretion
MGKPATRLGDLTQHGGTVSLGQPTILVGKMPASTLGDMHVCPMVTPGVPPIPHVGGPVSLGSTGVMVGKKPGARISDMAVCVGPPSMNALGCFTVMWGEVGGGSQGATAGSAANAQAASKKGPKAISPFPPAKPAKGNEHHVIDVLFVDSAGKPLSGVPYEIEDPGKKKIVGVSTLDGAAHYGGYAEKGSYTVTVFGLGNPKWSKTEAKLKEKVSYEAGADGYEDGTAATVQILEEISGKYRVLETIDTKVSGAKVKGDWTWKEEYLSGEPPEGIALEPIFRFQVVVGPFVVVSGPLKLTNTLTVKVTKAKDNSAFKDLTYEITLGTGQVKTGQLDASGKVTVEKVPPGHHKVRLLGTKPSAPAPGQGGSGATKAGGTTPPKPVETEKPAEAGADAKAAIHKPLNDEAKRKVVGFIVTSEGGKGEAAYYAMNLDYEFEGYWDLPKADAKAKLPAWYKRIEKDGKPMAKPAGSDPNVPYSKYSEHPRHVGLSFGIIQFTQEGPLGKLLKKMNEKDAAKFTEIFGEHSKKLLEITQKTGDFTLADEEIFDNRGASMGKKKVKRRPSVQPVGGQDLWKPYWSARFKNAGKYKPFQACQEDLAIADYMEPCLKALKDKGAKGVSEKSLALLYDRSVNNGSGVGAKLAKGLADAKDEKDYWAKLIKGYKASVKTRMQHLYDNAKASWDLIYDF